MPLDQEKTTSAMFVDEMFFPFLLRVARPMQDMNHPSSWSDNIYISRTSAVSSAGKREYVQRRGAKKKKKNPTATHEMGVSTDHDFLVSISLFLSFRRRESGTPPDTGLLESFYVAPEILERPKATPQSALTKGGVGVLFLSFSLRSSLSSSASPASFFRPG